MRAQRKKITFPWHTALCLCALCSFPSQPFCSAIAAHIFLSQMLPMKTFSIPGSGSFKLQLSHVHTAYICSRRECLVKVLHSHLPYFVEEDLQHSTVCWGQVERLQCSAASGDRGEKESLPRLSAGSPLPEVGQFLSNKRVPGSSCGQMPLANRRVIRKSSNAG